MATTVALQGRVYDLGSPERQQEAYVWMKANLGDTSRFEEEFPDAQVLASVLGGRNAQLWYHVFHHASDLGNGWVPSARVVFARDDGSTGVALRDLPELGAFANKAMALDACREVQVAAIRADGVVVFAHEQQ